MKVEFFTDAQRLALDDRFPIRGSENAEDFSFFASGRTGDPKGAVHRQSDIFYTNQTYCREVLRLREGDRLFSSSRLPFAYGLGNGFTFPLLNAFTTVLCRQKPTHAVISHISQEYLTLIYAVG